MLLVLQKKRNKQEVISLPWPPTFCPFIPFFPFQYRSKSLVNSCTNWNIPSSCRCSCHCADTLVDCVCVSPPLFSSLKSTSEIYITALYITANLQNSWCNSGTFRNIIWYTGCITLLTNSVLLDYIPINSIFSQKITISHIKSHHDWLERQIFSLKMRQTLFKDTMMTKSVLSSLIPLFYICSLIKSWIVLYI